MNREEFQNALRKGLGRAVQHVRNSPPEVVRDDLVHACTHFLGSSLQDEGSRAPWLFSMIEATGEPDFYRQRVITAFESMPDDPDDTQSFNELYGLLAELAVRGDAEVLAIMRRRFETVCGLHASYIGFYELFRIDGIDALIRFLCREWKRIQDDETLWAWDDKIKHAEETFGKETIQAALKKESLVNESVRLYLERLHRQESEKQAEETERKNFLQKPPSLPRLTELIDNYENLPQETRWTNDFFRDAFSQENLFAYRHRLCAQPTSDELEYAFQQLLKTTDPDRQHRLLNVFTKETMPRLEPRLLLLLDFPPDDLRWILVQAFSRMTDPQVRAKGLEWIAMTPDFSNWYDGDWYCGIDLLKNNYRPEDEALIQRSLESVSADNDDQDMHAIVTALIDLVKNNAEFSFEPILFWIYENSPCPCWRGDSVELMIQRNIASKNLLEECLDDSYESTRELARSALK